MQTWTRTEKDGTGMRFNYAKKEIQSTRIWINEEQIINNNIFM